MITKLTCEYVQPNMVYAGVSCSPVEAIRLLGDLVVDGMRDALLAQEASVREEAGQDFPSTPAYFLNLEWEDGFASLNVFCGPEGWFEVWEIRVRRWRWLPLFPKMVSIPPRVSNVLELGDDIAWVCQSDARGCADYLERRSCSKQRLDV